MLKNSKNITKADFYKELDNPLFIDFLIESVFIDVSTTTAMQLRGVSKMTIQRDRDSGKINTVKKRGNKRTYHYKFNELLMDKWNKKKLKQL